jgi:CubicO group peptidase (beta-lactamase class C family)
LFIHQFSLSGAYRSIQSVVVLVLFGFCIFLSFSSQGYAAENAHQAGGEGSIKKIVTEEKLTKLESYLKSAMKTLNVPGLTVGIVEKSEVVYAKSFGVSNADGTPVVNTTPFKLGSVSKSITSLAIMKLAEDGKIDIEQPVVTYLPWFQTSDKKRSDQVTIKHLLSHKSGFSKTLGNRNQDDTSLDDHRMESAVRELKDSSLLFSPGSAFHYSNTNYQILGYLVELLSGKRYSEYVGESIFLPLGMNQSFMQDNKSRLNGAAKGHIYWFGQPQSQTDNLGVLTTPQGGVYSSVQDMTQYLKMLLSDEAIVISNQSKEKMFAFESPEDQNGYGLGWVLAKIDGKKINYHYGHSAGFESLISYSNDLDIGWFVAVNVSSAIGDVNVTSLMGQVGPILNGKPAEHHGAPVLEMVLFWGILLVPLIFLFFSWRLQVKVKMKVGYLNVKQLSIGKLISRIVLPLMVALIGIWLLLVAMPNLNGASLSTVKLFHPLIFWLIVISSISMIYWAFLRIWFIKKVMI